MTMNKLLIQSNVTKYRLCYIQKNGLKLKMLDVARKRLKKKLQHNETKTRLDMTLHMGGWGSHCPASGSYNLHTKFLNFKVTFM